MIRIGAEFVGGCQTEFVECGDPAAFGATKLAVVEDGLADEMVPAGRAAGEIDGVIEGAANVKVEEKITKTQDGDHR